MHPQGKKWGCTCTPCPPCSYPSESNTLVPTNPEGSTLAHYTTNSKFKVALYACAQMKKMASEMKPVSNMPRISPITSLSLNNFLLALANPATLVVCSKQCMSALAGRNPLSLIWLTLANPLTTSISQRTPVSGSTQDLSVM